MKQIGSLRSQDMFLYGRIEDGPTLGPFNVSKTYITWTILNNNFAKINDCAKTDSNFSILEIKLHVTHVYFKYTMTLNNNDVDFYSPWFDNDQRGKPKHIKSLIQQEQHFHDLNSDMVSM
ncbi:unnamed protein product [Rotaria sp. Silwood2]|nr:unnamed protein product [Rotaria sp. Silwood2]